MSEPMKGPVRAVVFDVGRVLYQWDIRHLFDKLIADERELEWFLANVVTEEWHFEHDAGRPLSEMVPERIAMFPGHAHLIEAYAARFNETIPGPVPDTHEMVGGLAARGVPLFAITNFGAEFWRGFARPHPCSTAFATSSYRASRRSRSPIRRSSCLRQAVSAIHRLTCCSSTTMQPTSRRRRS